MSDFELLVSAVAASGADPRDYLNTFFVKHNFVNYQVPEDLDDEDRKAVRMMFESKKEIRKRAQSALDQDPLCLEAFFTYYLLSEDMYVYYSFREYFSKADEYADFDDSQQRRYLRILDFFVEFLLEIHNITEAVKVQRMIIRLNGDATQLMVNRLSYMYMLLEDDQEFYRLYLSYDFDEYDYLLLLVTLLKHQEEYKAREVLNDMLQKIDYADYLDHVWDLDQSDPKQKDFYQLVDGCTVQIDSVLDFFGWVNKNKLRA